MRIVRVNDDEERKLRQDNVSAYEDAGVSLLPDKQKRVKQILARLTEIDQEFSRNILRTKQGWFLRRMNCRDCRKII